MTDQVRFGSSAFRRFLIAVAALGLLTAAGGATLITLHAQADAPPREIQFASLSDPNVVFLQAESDPGLDPFTNSVAVDLGIDEALFVLPPLNSSAVESPHHRTSDADMLAAGALGFAVLSEQKSGEAVTVDALLQIGADILGLEGTLSDVDDVNGDGRDDDSRFTLTAADGSAVCVWLSDPRPVPLGMGLQLDPADGTPVSGYTWDPYGPCDDRVPPQTGEEVRVGSTPGVFGASTEGEVCDLDALTRGLLAVPIVGEAWAAVHGIAVEELPAFISSQTPVVLLRDTAVTDHGFRNGKIVSRQAVLQRGTAVLVDERGALTARCMSGSPLARPRPVPVDAELSGDVWAGFDMRSIDQVIAADRPVDSFVLVDVRTGRSISRQPGVTGALAGLAGSVYPPAQG